MHNNTEILPLGGFSCILWYTKSPNVYSYYTLRILLTQYPIPAEILLKFSLKIPTVSFLSDCRRFIVRPSKYNCNLSVKAAEFDSVSSDRITYLSSRSNVADLLSKSKIIRPNRLCIYIYLFHIISKIFSTIFTKSITSPDSK